MDRQTIRRDPVLTKYWNAVSAAPGAASLVRRRHPERNGDFDAVDAFRRAAMRRLRSYQLLGRGRGPGPIGGER